MESQIESIMEMSCHRSQVSSLDIPEICAYSTMTENGMVPGIAPIPPEMYCLSEAKSLQTLRGYAHIESRTGRFCNALGSIPVSSLIASRSAILSPHWSSHSRNSLSFLRLLLPSQHGRFQSHRLPWKQQHETPSVPAAFWRSPESRSGLHHGN